MSALLRRVGIVASIGTAVLVALPATVSAECNGPVCGEVEEGLDALGVVLLGAVLTVFVAVITVGGHFVRKDRRSND
jgi:hypothetical protein